MVPRLFFLPLVCLTLFAEAQNLNSPNKPGPLGTQVNTLSGNLFIPRTDLVIPARGFDLDISFYYNSYLHFRNYGYGNGWMFEYNIQYNNDTVAGRKIILWGDGREDVYDSIPGGAYKTPRGFYSRLVQYSPGKFRLREKDSITYFFDDPTHRKVTRMQHPNGNSIQFAYTSGRLTSLTNNAGQSIAFSYNSSGQLSALLDAVAQPSRTYTYKYDAAGNLLEVTDPLGGTLKYTYLTSGPMKTLADKNNNKLDIIYFPDFSTREIIGCNKRMSFSYDTLQKKTVVTDYVDGGTNQVTTYTYQRVDNLSWVTSMKGNCCGFNISYEYDEQGNNISTTDANGNVYTYTYDEAGNMLTETDPLGGQSIYTYSSDFNKITSYRDPNQHLYTLEYDSKGNLIKLTAPNNAVYTATYSAVGDILTSTDPKGGVFTYNYDAFGNPTTVTGPNGYNATLSFDARGNLLSFTDSRGNAHAAEFDILNRLKKITDPLNRSTQFTYDAVGNLVSTKNKANETTTVQYDASNRPVKVTGPTGSTAEIGYDAMDNITRVKDPMGQQTSFGYDTRNRLTKWKDALRNEANYSYDGNGNVISASFANGRTVYFTYDKADRLTKVSDGTGDIAAYTYDAAGNMIRYKNGTGAEISGQYDAQNRLVKAIDPLGNSTSYTYDANNNIASIIDRNGFTSHYTYDSLNRMTTFTDNNGFVIKVGYDASGNVTQLTDQNNNTTIYTYDELNRRKTMTFPDGSFQQYSYDAESNLTSKRLTDGSTITYAYDTLNRVISKTLPGGEVYRYTYDKMGRVVSATNNQGTVQISYDALGRITSETAAGRTVSYSYNTAGRTQTIVYPDGSEVVKEFDTRNRLSRILKDSLLVAEYAYNNANQLTTKRSGNGVESNLQYDVANRLVNLTTAGGTIQQLQYTYDKEGNKKAVSRLNNPSLNESFVYDNNYRLVDYTRGSQQATYTYDAVGNRTAATINGVGHTYTVNNLNQLTSHNGVNFTFDNRGNLTYDGQFYKTYDAESRLMKDSSSPTSVLTYAYDVFGRRVLKSINGNAFQYTYSGAAEIEERDASNTIINQTVVSNFLTPVMNKSAGQNFYYHQNEMMSVEAITNNAGRFLETYRYDAYGKPQRFDSLNNPLASSLAGNRFGFTGQEWDSASNSYRFFYRNYSPETGVFNQRDLIEYGDGMGMYQYVGNNPANGVDVWGLEDCDEWKKKIKEGYETLTDINGNLMGFFNEETLKSTHRRLDKIGKKYSRGFGKEVGKYSRRLKNLSANKWLPAGRAVAGKLAAVNMVTETIDAYGEFVDGASNPQYTEEWEQGADLLLAASGAHPLGAIYNFVDGLVVAQTDQKITDHVADVGELYGSNEVESSTEIEDAAWKHAIEQGKGRQWAETRRRMDRREREHRQKKPCPEGGTQLRPRYVWDPITGQLRLVWPIDPNEIVGPDGVEEKKWVSVKDRLTYTIRCENDSAASAPARYIRITSIIHPKHDANTIELGGFGFNNQTFEIPQGQSSYYQRLDCRDSMGLFVDVVAGYNQISKEVFWEFRGIDPITLLPSEDPEKGILFLQDTAQPLYGHGYVAFSIKPQFNAATLDTTAASAAIVFDENEPILTNVWVNIIDAVAPTSALLAGLPASISAVSIPIQYSATDDANGVGFKSADLYVSVNNAQPVLWVSNFTSSDTSFIGLKGNTYSFFASALDKVNNKEELKNIGSVTIRVGDCIGSDFVFTSNISGASYQWQVDDGSGFVHLANNATYEGVNNQTLVVKATSGPMAGYRYRAVVDGGFSQTDTLRFVSYWLGSVSEAWEDPLNWSCSAVPNEYTDVIIEGEKARYPVVNSNPSVRTLRTDRGSSLTIRNGYNLTILK
jgi:RHS repeat-associated protein